MIPKVSGRLRALGMESSSIVYDTHPAVLDLPGPRANPYLVRALIGADACLDVLARDYGQISAGGALRFKIGEREDSWVYVVLAADNTYAVEAGRSVVGGRLDGAWIRLGFHGGVRGDQLAEAVRSCSLEV